MLGCAYIDTGRWVGQIRLHYALRRPRRFVNVVPRLKLFWHAWPGPPAGGGGQIAPAQDRSFPLDQAPEALRQLIEDRPFCKVTLTVTTRAEPASETPVYIDR